MQQQWNKHTTCDQCHNCLSILGFSLSEVRSVIRLLSKKNEMILDLKIIQGFSPECPGLMMSLAYSNAVGTEPNAVGTG